MSLSELLKKWQTDLTFVENVSAWHATPARPADTRPLPPTLHPALRELLRGQGLDSLYSHQAQTWDRVQAGQHPAIVTGTASGKTLCYNLPILHQLLCHADSRALYLFPTKAWPTTKPRHCNN